MWVKKPGYSTFNLADEKDLNSSGAEVQLVRFSDGKYQHYHKKKTEFFYFLKGKGAVMVDGKKIILGPGTPLLIKPNMHHAFLSDPSDPLEAIQIKTNSSAEDTFTDDVPDE